MCYKWSITNRQKTFISLLRDTFENYIKIFTTTTIKKKDLEDLHNKNLVIFNAGKFTQTTNLNIFIETLQNNNINNNIIIHHTDNKINEEFYVINKVQKIEFTNIFDTSLCETIEKQKLMLLVIEYYSKYKNANYVIKINLNNYSSKNICSKFIIENTKQSNKNIHCIKIYDCFKSWMLLKFPEIKIVSEVKFYEELRKKYTVDKIKINNNKQLGIKNLELKTINN